MEETTNLNLPFVMPSQAQKHVPVNEAMRALDAVVQLAVLDRDLPSPPALPAEGQRYIVAAGASGAWLNAADRIAAFQDGAWAFYQPRTGWLCWVADESILVIWNGAAWVSFSATFSALQSLSRLGLGTVADATNPFAAKLNRALWAAKTAAEGGDGDLRFVINKEAASDFASLLLQTGYSGRAEIGLVGDDDLLFKVSANGSAFIEALRIDKTSGRLAILGQVKFPATQSASTDVNTLDDYREGATTPAVTAGSGTLTTATAALDYQKVGKWVSFQATVTVTTAGSGAGALNIALPFAVSGSGSAGGIEAALTNAAVAGAITGSTLSIFRYDGTTIIANGRVVRIGGKYPTSA